MGIKLLFFTVFSKFVAHESVAFMLVLFSCYSRCLLIFFFGGVFGVSPKTLWVCYVNKAALPAKTIKKQLVSL